MLDRPQLFGRLAVGAHFEHLGAQDFLLPAGGLGLAREGEEVVADLPFEGPRGRGFARDTRTGGKQEKRGGGNSGMDAGGAASGGGGGGRIRTHENLAALLVFKTSAFNHSATPPSKARILTIAGAPVHPAGRAAVRNGYSLARGRRRRGLISACSASRRSKRCARWQLCAGSYKAWDWLSSGKKRPRSPRRARARARCLRYARGAGARAPVWAWCGRFRIASRRFA